MPIEREDVARLEMKPVTTSSIRRRINLLGAGGVGSNFVRLCCMQYGNFAISVYDHDTVELHNLNRTSMFSLQDAISGQSKVAALRYAAGGVSGVQVNSSQNPVVRAAREEVGATYGLGIGLTIDARDTMDPAKILPGTWLKLAYDGGSNISFTWLPAVVADKVFDLTAGRSNTYEVVPSFYVPAAMLSAMALRFLQFPNFLEITELRAGTFHCDIDDLAEQVSYGWDRGDPSPARNGTDNQEETDDNRGSE